MNLIKNKIYKNTRLSTNIISLVINYYYSTEQLLFIIEENKNNKIFVEPPTESLLEIISYCASRGHGGFYFPCNVHFTKMKEYFLKEINKIKLCKLSEG